MSLACFAKIFKFNFPKITTNYRKTIFCFLAHFNEAIIWKLSHNDMKNTHPPCCSWKISVHFDIYNLEHWYWCQFHRPPCQKLFQNRKKHKLLQLTVLEIPCFLGSFLKSLLCWELWGWEVGELWNGAGQIRPGSLTLSFTGDINK